MYRFVIEHPRWIPAEDLAKVDVRAGSSLGRIYRIRPKDVKPRTVPHLDKLDTSGLVAALDSANGWQRDLASQMLLWRNDKTAVKGLEDLAVNSLRPEARLHALCVLDGLGQLALDVVQPALTDPHAGVRRHSVRLAEKFLNTSPFLGLKLLKLVHDPDAQVRLQLAYSLGEWRDARAGLGLSVLGLEHGNDPYLTAAVLSSVRKENVKEVLAGVLAARASRSERLLSQLVATAVALGETGALPQLLRNLASPRESGFAAWQFTALAGVLDALQRRGQTLDGIVDGSTANLVRRMLVHARVLAADTKTSEVERLAAIGVLGRETSQHRADLTALERLLLPQSPTTVQSAAVSALGRIPKKEAADDLIAAWKSHTPTVKTQVLDVLLGREPWQILLLAAIEHKKVPAAHIDAGRRQRLLTSKNRDIRMLAAKVFAGAIDSDRQKVIDDYRQVLSMSGDINRGKAVFAKKCASCHRLHDMGAVVGPDLASLSVKTPLYLLTEILDPNRNVDSRYLEYLAVTKAGRTFAGLLASETSTSITLRGQEGKDQILLRSELESFQSTGKSLMPEGMERDLSRQDMADLIGYLTAK
jgi:putative heme-binding domain-containing protein